MRVLVLLAAVILAFIGLSTGVVYVIIVAGIMFGLWICMGVKS